MRDRERVKWRTNFFISNVVVVFNVFNASIKHFGTHSPGSYKAVNNKISFKYLISVLFASNADLKLIKVIIANLISFS